MFGPRRPRAETGAIVPGLFARRPVTQCAARISRPRHALEARPLLLPVSAAYRTFGLLYIFLAVLDPRRPRAETSGVIVPGLRDRQPVCLFVKSLIGKMYGIFV